MNKKIIFLITGLTYGGAEKQLLSLATVLKRRGWNIYVVSMCEPVAYQTEFSKEKIPLISLYMRKKIHAISALYHFRKLINSIKPELVHSHMIHANIFARVSRYICKFPTLVCTAHNIYEGGKWREYAYRLTDKLSDLTTNVCQAGVSRSISIKTVSSPRIRYIPNGVNISQFKYNSDIRKKIRKKMKAENKFVFLAVGRFVEQKDYPNMLTAFKYVIDTEPNVLLLVVGDGPLKNEMEGLKNNIGICQNVRFLGIRKDISEIMNGADAYVMSSAWEGLPIVLLEAAAVGLPIVATDVGGNCEVVKIGENGNGYLVPPRNPKRLADAMTLLVKKCDADLLRMRTSSAAIVSEHYNIEKVASIWENIYEEYILSAQNI